jgi:hypothetical protein
VEGRSDLGRKRGGGGLREGRDVTPQVFIKDKYLN